MAQLMLLGSAIDTVFDLLGRDENDRTYALGWGLTRSDALLAAFIRALGLEAVTAGDVAVSLQQHEAAGGFTDIEISSATDLHLIVEAKRGWWLPTRTQLDRYAERL